MCDVCAKCHYSVSSKPNYRHLCMMFVPSVAISISSKPNYHHLCMMFVPSVTIVSHQSPNYHHLCVACVLNVTGASSKPSWALKTWYLYLSTHLCVPFVPRTTGVLLKPTSPAIRMKLKLVYYVKNFFAKWHCCLIKGSLDPLRQRRQKWK